MKRVIAIIVVLVSVMSFLAGMYAKPEGRIIEPVINLTCEKPIVNLTCPDNTDVITNYVQDCQTTDIAEIAANLVKEHTYSDWYNCESYANELVRRYNNAGYETYKCEGRMNDNYCTPEGREKYDCRHDWVKVCSYVEATTGKPITPDDYKNQYIESWCRKD